MPVMSDAPHIRIIFFGSTEDSCIVLDKLSTFHFPLLTCSLRAVVTQPPRPVGRTQRLTPTPVQAWATAHNIRVLSFASDDKKPWCYNNEQGVIDALQPLKADLLVSACYGQKIPLSSVASARYGGINVHPSLLPRWRGADPVPWAILSGDRETGVSIVTISEAFDAGAIIAQKKIALADTDTSDLLRRRLFTIGADLLTNMLPGYIADPTHSSFSILHSSTYARRLTRDDGYEPWEAIEKSFTDANEAIRIDRKFLAFHHWPGLWTQIVIRDKGNVIDKTKRRMKIISLHFSLHTPHISLDLVQLEGKKPVPWKQFARAYFTS